MRAQMKITEERRRVFLEELAKHGIFNEAARVASPAARGRRGAHATFRGLMQRDPEFAMQVEEARQTALGRLEKAAWDRAVNGVARPIVQKGAVVAYDYQFSDNLMLALLRSRDPRFREKTSVELSGSVNHQHIGVMVTPEDLLALDDAKREQLAAILEVIADARGEKDEPEPALLPAPFEGVEP